MAESYYHGGAFEAQSIAIALEKKSNHLALNATYLKILQNVLIL
jgi:hypothetical protein